jgi:hypothetical protein
MKQKPSEPLEFFRRLGATVENEWRARDYDDRLFPEIAAEALAKHSPAGRVDPWQIIRLLSSGQALPNQQDVDARFSNLPITLFTGARFFIDVYFWLDGTTAIHQHGFAGAFQVLLGSSIHSHYGFATEQYINPHFSFGRLFLKKVKLLSTGDIKQIIPGSSYIHSLFHLDRPSATITVRTPGLPSAQPQFSYRKPGIAFDPFFKEPALIKETQGVHLLLGMRHPDADAVITEMLATSDIHTGFVILETVYQYLRPDAMENFLGVSQGTDRFTKLLSVARGKHGRLVDYFPAAFIETEQQTELVRRRNYVHEPEHRFFFALLLNVTGRKRILDLVRQRFPNKPPVDTILDWIEELSQTKALGLHEPNALGIEGFGPEHLLVLEGLLKNKPRSQTMKELRGIYKTAEPKTNRQISQIYDSLLNSRTLSPLFAQAKPKR